MSNNIDRSAVIFGNEMDEQSYRKACRTKQGFVRRFRESKASVHLASSEAPVIGRALGVRWLQQADAKASALDIRQDAAAAARPAETQRAVAGADDKPVVVGNIRMGFGHYRIAMAFASAAHAMGYTPYWFDLCGFKKTRAGKIIESQNKLYSMGSRMSQKSKTFNKVVWDPMNSEGFRKLSYNASDQKVAELMTAPFADLPCDVPFIGTHAWTAQAAVHAGLTNVVNAIPDNWPMALHLAEGSKHIVQTPSAALGYRALRGMDKGRVLTPMPAGSVVNVGHYIDHELVSNIEVDCARRTRRLRDGEPTRYLLSVGGAGAQQDLFVSIIQHLMPAIEHNEAVLFINVGDHKDVWEALVKAVPGLSDANCCFSDFEGCAQFAEEALDGSVSGIHAFYDSDIFAAVYSTNLLMRACDVLITKPSELSFYPVPKLMTKRVGGHEAWGAIRAAEVGDGTYEIETAEEIAAMIDLMQSDPGIIVEMCENIKRANKLGIYDGAYHGVALACGE